MIKTYHETPCAVRNRRHLLRVHVSESTLRDASRVHLQRSCVVAGGLVTSSKERECCGNVAVRRVLVPRCDGHELVCQLHELAQQSVNTGIDTALLFCFPRQ
jgi:hypothetical protein